MSDNQIRFGQMENNDNTVSVGDQIVTSYISDKYLQGILIGYVSEVTVDSNNLTRSGYITPAVDFKNLSGSSCYHNNESGFGWIQSERIGVNTHEINEI